MSKLADFRAIERQIAELLEAQERLKDDKDFQKDRAFDEGLTTLMHEYGFQAKDVIAILCPELTDQEQPQKARRKPRVEKIFLNPHTGQTVATRGGNNKIIGEWKARYSAEVVESWVQS